MGRASAEPTPGLFAAAPRRRSALDCTHVGVLGHRGDEPPRPRSALIATAPPTRPPKSRLGTPIGPGRQSLSTNRRLLPTSIHSVFVASHSNCSLPGVCAHASSTAASVVPPLIPAHRNSRIRSRGARPGSSRSAISRRVIVAASLPQETSTTSSSNLSSRGPNMPARALPTVMSIVPFRTISRSKRALPRRSSTCARETNNAADSFPSILARKREILFAINLADDEPVAITLNCMIRSSSSSFARAKNRVARLASI